MEKKKLLLVAISVGIFLVIAIGAAILFTPKNNPVISQGVPAHITPASPNQPFFVGPDPVETALAIEDEALDQVSSETFQPVLVDAVDMVRSSENVPGLKSPPESVIRQGGDYYIRGNSETVINIPKPSSAAVPEATTTNRNVNTTPRSNQETPKQPVAVTPKTTAPAANTAPKKAPVQTKVYDDYWVQTGAFSTVATAEGVKQTLATKGITSIIENRVVDGKTLFRVRIGPYTSQNEADYWLSLIKTINGFEDSQIRQTQSRR